MRLLYNIFIRIMNFMVFFVIVVLMPGLPPQTTFPFKEFVVSPTKELKGALEPNHHLEGATRLLDARVYGPECLISRKNEIYTGIHGGEVIKLTGDHVTHITKIGQPCEDIFEEARCGRPLGLAFDTQGNNLIIADAYYGLWQFDLITQKKKLLVSPRQELPGKSVNRVAKIFNGVAVDQAGDIYWTDSSSDFTIQDLVFASFANPSGRLFKYDRSKNASKVLLDELFFANGVALSPEEDFVVVAETGGMRLLKYYVKGAKAGKSEVFVDGLPGLPDNLSPDAEGLWVPLVMSADSEHPSAFSMLSQFPTIRIFLARLLSLFELPFRLIHNAYPNKLAQRFIHFIGHGESISLLSPKRSTVVRVDWSGNIVGSLHGFDKSVNGISHVLEFNNQLLLGSPFNRYIAHIRNPKTSKQHTAKVKNVRAEGVFEPTVKTQSAPSQVKPATTTTTTPRSTTISTAANPTTTTTTTSRPRTTTTTRSKPTSTTPTTTPTPATTTTPKVAPKTTTSGTQQKINQNFNTGAGTSAGRMPPKQPAPIKEEIPIDVPPQKQEKLKVINKRGEHVEL